MADQQIDSLIKLKGSIGALIGLRSQKEVIEEELKELNKKIGEYENTIVTTLDVMGVKSINIEELGVLVTRASRLYAQAKDKQAMFLWLEANGYQSAIKPTVSPSTLSGIVRELLEDGNSMIPEFIEVYYKAYPSIKKK